MSNAFKIAICAALLFANQFVAANAADDTVVKVDFQELSTGFAPCPSCDPTADLAGVGSTYSVNGYTFYYAPKPDEPYPIGFYVAGPFWPYNNGTNALIANSDGATTLLTRDDGQPFALVAIDLAELNGISRDFPTIVFFRGVTPSGEVVSHQFTLNNKVGFQTFHLPGRFRDVVSVEWQQGDNIVNGPHMFDNVTLLPSKRSTRSN